MQAPTIGRAVHVLVDPADNNGTDIAHATVTRAWSYSGEFNRWTVNYRILYDTDEPPPLVTSAYLYEDEDAARKAGMRPDVAAFWPPQV